MPSWLPFVFPVVSWTHRFVSHVRADLIGAAREAGAEVLPRSAFAAGLGNILKGAGAAGAL